MIRIRRATYFVLCDHLSNINPKEDSLRIIKYLRISKNEASYAKYSVPMDRDQVTHGSTSAELLLTISNQQGSQGYSNTKLRCFSLMTQSFDESQE